MDALRVDAYSGVSSRLSLIAAWAGAPVHAEGRGNVTLRDVILVAQGQTTVGVTDILLLAGVARDEGVLGAGFSSSVGPVGIHGDATLTLPAEEEREEDPFVRAVVGADWRPTSTTTLSGELYYSGFGTGDPEEYLEVLLSPRFDRGEVWQVGRYYASVAAVQEITPLITASLAVVANVEEPSAFLAPSVSWSVSDEASLAAGAYVGLGASADFTNPVAPLQSEFGATPPTAFAQLRAYF